MLPTDKKRKLIEKSRVHEKDTGSSNVQIALLGEQIARLADHLKKYRKDNHSRRGLLKMVAKRKTLLEYLAKGDAKKLSELQRRFGIKK
jgi:small subunit ribosomal protein S15